MTQPIGFIGLGHLGKHLASSLLRADFDIVVFDLNDEAVTGLVALGARRGRDPASVASQCTTVITCLPSPTAIDSVVTGTVGLLQGFTIGSTWIDMSTNDRDETLRLAELCARRGVQVLECPVTGGVHKAAEGDITVLVGGDSVVFAQHRHILEAMGSPILYMGPLGNAATIKVITNMLAFIHLVAVGEALMLAKQGGLDLGQAYEAIRHSSGNSFVHETEGQVILNGSYDIGFTMDLACKDLGFAADLGEKLGVPLELATLVQNIFIRSRLQYGGHAWSSKVVKLLEDSVGTELRAPGFPERLQ